MAIQITRWERRDNADRDALGHAALNHCRAVRATEGMRSARFYWANTDTIAVLADAESQEVFDRPPTPDGAKAAFALSDLARPVGMERWMEPGAGEQAFRMSR